MGLGELQRLHDWLENREPLVSEFKELVRRSHPEPWPNFVVTGLAHDISKGILKPSSKGYPEGRMKYAVGEGPHWRTVVELAARITAVRSRRWDPITQTVKPIPPAWSSLTRETFPFLCHLAISDGWSDLIIAMCGMLTEAGLPPGYQCSQIKEKYGTLRWYDDGNDERINDIVEAGENLSGHICDTCGAPGREREGGWVSTKCDQHA